MRINTIGAHGIFNITKAYNSLKSSSFKWEIIVAKFQEASNQDFSLYLNNVKYQNPWHASILKWRLLIRSQLFKSDTYCRRIKFRDCIVEGVNDQFLNINYNQLLIKKELKDDYEPIPLKKEKPFDIFMEQYTQDLLSRNKYGYVQQPIFKNYFLKFKSLDNDLIQNGFYYQYNYSLTCDVKRKNQFQHVFEISNLLKLKMFSFLTEIKRFAKEFTFLGIYIVYNIQMNK